jgi:hypothetical protein
MAQEVSEAKARVLNTDSTSFSVVLQVGTVTLGLVRAVQVSSHPAPCTSPSVVNVIFR